jgi:hypothetical protein
VTERSGRFGFGPRSGARRAALALGFLALVGTPLLARVAFEGRAELQAAERAKGDGDVELEILHLGRAARWRAPILGHDEDARQRLHQIGEDAFAEGEDGERTALQAFRELRSALLATRTFDVPDPELLEQANARIADLMAAQEVRFGRDPIEEPDARAWHLQRLAAPPGPVPWRAFGAAFAFLGWIACTGGFVLRGLDAAGKLRPGPAVRWGLGSVVLLVVWAVLLSHSR